MRYLAIGRSSLYLSYAFFDNVVLEDFGIIRYSEEADDKRLMGIEEKIRGLIAKHVPTVILTHLLKDRTPKRELAKIVEIRTIIKLVCAKEKVIYVEFKTDGWEKRITYGNPSQKAKLDLINKAYGTNIKNIDVANTIILGEGVAHNRLQIGE